jgi:glycosyltransferase involved in cell wall biosynthesis
MKIWIDAKNASSQNAGIAKWSEFHLSQNKLDFNADLFLVYPSKSKYKPYGNLDLKRKKLYTFTKLPLKLSILIYDLLTFRIYASIEKPDLIFSPYFDVLMPTKIKSIIAIHDLCYLEVPLLYPFPLRLYFLWVMKKNAQRASLIVTVSETSKKQILKYLQIPDSKVVVLPNQIDEDFKSYDPNEFEIVQFRSQFSGFQRTLLYTSGFENRKNLPMLLSAIKKLNANGFSVCLLITGFQTKDWAKTIKSLNVDRRLIKFLGYLSNPQLKVAYKASNAVIYPSLSEGFGRACIEAISCNTPLICSDIPIFREVCGNYPFYFDPNNLQSLMTAIQKTFKEGSHQKTNLILSTGGSKKLQKVMEQVFNGD